MLDFIVKNTYKDPSPCSISAFKIDEHSFVPVFESYDNHVFDLIKKPKLVENSGKKSTFDLF